jgi:hypothetical protein
VKICAPIKVSILVSGHALVASVLCSVFIVWLVLRVAAGSSVAVSMSLMPAVMVSPAYSLLQWSEVAMIVQAVSRIRRWQVT